MARQIKYFVFRYQYHNQSVPLWDAVPVSWGRSNLPHCILPEPGLFEILAMSKAEAIGVVRGKFSLN